MDVFNHSVVVQNEAITAATVVSYDLPVNPLSHLLLTIKFAQNQANTQLTFANIAAMLSKVEVLYKGSAVASYSGVDLLALNCLLLGFVPWRVNATGDDNELLAYTWVIPFGRNPYRPDEAFPKTERGKMTLQITYAASFTQIDTTYLQVEAVELPAASPTRFLKVTTLTGTPAATGQFDVNLPIGNIITDLILFGTTIAAGATATTTISAVQIRRNNAEHMYGLSNFETLLGMQGLWQRPVGDYSAHIHQIDGAAFAQYMDSGPVKSKAGMIPNHLRIPFDVLGDGTYGLDTGGATSLVLRVTAGDTNAIRVLPCELISVVLERGGSVHGCERCGREVGCGAPFGGVAMFGSGCGAGGGGQLVVRGDACGWGGGLPG